MRKSTLILVVLWTISLFMTLIFSVLLISDFFQTNNINFHSITSGVNSLSESIADTFNYSEDTIISGYYDAVDIETDSKLIIKLSENENISVSQFHSKQDISEENNKLIIKSTSNHDESEKQMEAKTIIYLPQDKIQDLTIKSTNDVNIENVNFTNVNANIVHGNLNLYGSDIEKLSGVIVDGQLNNSARVKDDTIKVNENQ